MSVTNLPTDLAQAVNSAYRLYYTLDFESAYNLCIETLARHPGSFDHRYLKGLIELRNGEIVAGHSSIADARSLFPEIKRFDFTADFLEERFGTNNPRIWEYRLEAFQKHSMIENYIVSYPKCGRTWMRYVLGTYALGERKGDPLEVVVASARAPDIPTTEFTHDDIASNRRPENLVQDKSIYRNKRIVLLVRDPRDVIVSLYFQTSRRTRLWDFGPTKFEGSLSQFLREPVGGIASLVAFYNIWAQNRHVPREFLLVRYENLRAEPRTVFHQVMRFLNWPWHGEPAFERAVKAGDFEAMQRLEASGAAGNLRLTTINPDDPASYKVRRGIVGGYRDHLSAVDIDFLDDYLAQNLDSFYADYKARTPAQSESFLDDGSI